MRSISTETLGDHRDRLSATRLAASEAQTSVYASETSDADYTYFLKSDAGDWIQVETSFMNTVPCPAEPGVDKTTRTTCSGSDGPRL